MSSSDSTNLTGLLADNGQSAHNFHHDNAIYDGVDVIGRSQHMQFLIDQGRIAYHWKTGGLSLQPNEGMGRGTTIKNSSFKGFNNGCSGEPRYAIHVGNNQVRNGVFDASPTIFNNTFDDEPVSSRISACWGIHNSTENDVRNVVIEDVDGSISGIAPGFFVQDEPALTSFVDTTKCQVVEDSCLLFCENSCLRVGIVSISQDFTTRGFQMHISDGTNTAKVRFYDAYTVIICHVFVCSHMPMEVGLSLVQRLQCPAELLVRLELRSSSTRPQRRNF